MIVLLDVNILMDVVMRRSPWVAESSQIWDLCKAGRIEAHVSAFSLPTLFYLVRRHSDLTYAFDAIDMCLALFEVAPTTRETIELARQLQNSDFEDCIQIATAMRLHADAIVTRDASGFAQSDIPVFTPAELIAKVSFAS